MSKASGSMDKGAQTVTNFFITEDPNINPATEPAVDSGPDPKCNPFRVILTDTSSTQTKTLNAIGVTCKKVNSSLMHVSDTIVGGWGIADISGSDPLPLASGWGTLSGSTNHSTNALSLAITGLVTE